jgi:hypothetical protein
LQSPSNQYHFDNAPPICNPEDYVIICTGYNLMWSILWKICDFYCSFNMIYLTFANFYLCRQKDDAIMWFTITMPKMLPHCWVNNPNCFTLWFDNTVKPAHVVTSIKQSPLLKGHFFLVLS